MGFNELPESKTPETDANVYPPYIDVPWSEWTPENVQMINTIHRTLKKNSEPTKYILFYRQPITIDVDSDMEVYAFRCGESNPPNLSGHVHIVHGIMKSIIIFDKD